MPNEVTQTCPECGKNLETKMHPKATGRHGECQIDYLRRLWKKADFPLAKSALEELAHCVTQHQSEWESAQDKAKEVQ